MSADSYITLMDKYHALKAEYDRRGRAQVAARRAVVAWAASTHGADDVRRLYPLMGEAMAELAAVVGEGKT